MCRYLIAAFLVVVVSMFAYQQVPAAILSAPRVENEIKQTIRERLAALESLDAKT